jgi:hypothetical protein
MPQISDFIIIASKFPLDPLVLMKFQFTFWLQHAVLESITPINNAIHRIITTMIIVWQGMLHAAF